MIILYGSQTGNAESIAEELYNQVENTEKTLLSLDKSLDLFKDKKLIENKKLIIVCSTTGNGDIPINAEKWWRFIKNRKLEKNYLENITYYFLALGDSNYDQFCGAGKKIFKRLKDLNAIPLHNLITIDDVDGDYEEKIDYLIKLINNDSYKN